MERSHKQGHGKLELLPILEAPQLDIWPLLLILKAFDDVDVQNLICCKLNKIPIRRLEFFLPQLCQLVLDRGKTNIKRTLPLKRFLVNQCRRSVRSALLIFFYFHSAFQDNNIDIYGQILKECHVASISGNRDTELNQLFDLYLEQIKTHSSTPSTPLRVSQPPTRSETPTPRSPPPNYPPPPLPTVVAPTPGGKTDDSTNGLPTKLNDEQISIIEQHVRKMCDSTLEGFDDVPVPPPSSILYGKSFDTVSVKNYETFAGSVINFTSRSFGGSLKTNDKPTLEDFETLHGMYDSIQKHSKQLFDKHLGPEENDENILFENVIQKRLHKDYFHAQLKLIRALTSISTLLVNLKLPDKELKGQALRLALKNLNKNKGFMKGVYIPIFTPSGVPYRVVHIPHHHAFPLNSRERVPYMLTLEVVSGYFESKYFDKTPSTAKKNPLEKSKSKENLGQQMEYQPNSGEEQEDFKVTKLVDSYKIINDWSSSKESSPPIMEAAFGSTWEERKEKIRQSSPVGFLPGWDAISVIVKSGDDLRQEQLAMQMIQAFYEIFNEEKIPLWLNPYMVLSTSQDAGLIETVRDAISIDSLKKSTGVETLVAYFAKAYGSSDTRYNQALRNFVESLAAYSIVCYLLQIKDRHNGNILIDRQAHIIHIDYGFMLSSSPGNLQFEKAPFKLPLEFVELMGGVSGDIFTYFKTLFRSGFVAVRKHYKKILSLVELMMNAGGGKMACFQMGEATMMNLKARFALTISDEEVLSFADNLVNESAGNWRTDAYDKYQQLTNNISQ